jgi:hypothetical protein
MPEIDSRLEEIAKVIRSDADLRALRKHLEQVIGGDAFRGSKRSGQFLQHIVDKAIAQESDGLKERTIGIELFGRKADYDTGDDAIVRVTASEVRRRLLQHYGRFGDKSEFRINLPPGGYGPEIYRNESAPVNVKRDRETKWGLVSAEEQTPDPSPAPLPFANGGNEIVSTIAMSKSAELTAPVRMWPRWLYGVVAIALLVLAFLSGLLLRVPPAKRMPDYPWSFLISPSVPLQIVTSDPNIAEIRGLTRHDISVSDYANRRYGCEVLANDLRFVCDTILQGDKAAAVDAKAVAMIAAHTQSYGGKFSVHVARSMRMSDFQTDNGYVLLGSPRSNPWFELFSGQMGFRIAYDPASSEDVIFNSKLQKNELPVYKPTAKGLGTGQSYAVIAFVRNPDQQGQVLLLAGASAEGTLAAANLMGNSESVASLRKACNISGPALVHFEALIRVNTMAGASTKSEVTTCHIIP